MYMHACMLAFLSFPSSLALWLAVCLFALESRHTHSASPCESQNPFYILYNELNFKWCGCRCW